jgi:hypothetical protein
MKNMSQIVFFLFLLYGTVVFANFQPTSGDDYIDARELAGDDYIDALAGNDTVLLREGQTFASGLGNDTVIGSGQSDYALWFATEEAYVNLQEGFAEDGFGGQDTISGISTIHLSNHSNTVIGSSSDEQVFCFGSNSYIDLAGGRDKVIMYQIDSSDYTARLIDDVWHFDGTDSLIEIHQAESVEFLDRTYVTPTNGFIYGDSYTAYSFIETERSDGWWYADVYYEPQLISYFPQAVHLLDIGADADLDVIVPMSKGYRTGVDSRFHFIVLENVEGQLVYNDEMTSTTPFITGSRRIATIYLQSLNSEALVSIAHDTAIEAETRYDIPWRLGDIAILTANPFADVTTQLIPAATLPDYGLTGRDTAVDAHSMAVGDINNDGLDDILVGEFSSPFALLQTESGAFVYQTSDFFHSLTNHWLEPTLVDATGAVLIDLHLEDLNGDGADDLVVGWGHATVLSRVFFNDGAGGFGLDNSDTLPETLYGHDNSLHMKTFSEDFDGDGDQDLLILHTRYEPYYGGNYIQLLDNDGNGHFTDLTVSRLGDPELLDDTYAERLQWTNYWYLQDVNDDESIDIIGHTVSGYPQSPFVYINDGSDHFTKTDYPVLLEGQPIIWGDFDHDTLLEMVTFNSQWTDESGSSNINQFNVHELKTSDSLPEGGVENYITAKLYHQDEADGAQYVVMEVKTPNGYENTEDTSVVITGPNGYNYEFDTATEYVTEENRFRAKKPSSAATAPTETGLYTAKFIVAGKTYSDLTRFASYVHLPNPDSNSSQVKDLGNGYLTFSWGDVDSDADLYYRVVILNEEGESYPTQFQESLSSTVNYIDIATIIGIGPLVWRVEVQDNSSWNTFNNRSLGDVIILNTQAFDADTDNDGIIDGFEDLNQNGIVDNGETNPYNPDSDGDGIQDGTELGYTFANIGSGTNTTIFTPDADPSTMTNPLLKDTDGDGLEDGQEDENKNGRIDKGESDPNKPLAKGDVNGDGSVNLHDAFLVMQINTGQQTYESIFPSSDTNDDGILNLKDAMYILQNSQ